MPIKRIRILHKMSHTNGICVGNLMKYIGAQRWEMDEIVSSVLEIRQFEVQAAKSSQMFGRTLDLTRALAACRL